MTATRLSIKAAHGMLSFDADSVESWEVTPERAGHFRLWLYLDDGARWDMEVSDTEWTGILDTLHPKPLHRRLFPVRAKVSKARRFAVRTRAADECELHLERCLGRGDQVHHVVRRCDGGGNVMDNLRWVCDPCHAEHHRRNT